MFFNTLRRRQADKQQQLQNSSSSSSPRTMRGLGGWEGWKGGVLRRCSGNNLLKKLNAICQLRVCVYRDLGWPGHLLK